MTPVLQISHLTRRHGSVLANDDISLTAASGQVLGLLGHNGAGKTTLVSQVVGLLRPDHGSIRLGDLDAVAHPAAARRLTAIQPQAQSPIDGLTPRTAIQLSGRLRGLPPQTCRARAQDLAEELDITKWFDRRALPEGGGLSGGIRRLTGFAMAVVAPTPLLILDEPTNDIDASRRRLLWEAVRRRADQGAAVLLVTHNVSEAERIVDELVILDAGRVVGAGSPGQLRGSSQQQLRLELQLRPDAADLDTTVQPTTIRRVDSGRRVLLTIPEREAPAAVAWAQQLVDTDQVEGFSLSPVTLEDTYLALTAPASSGSAQEVDHV